VGATGARHEPHNGHFGEIRNPFRVKLRATCFALAARVIRSVERLIIHCVMRPGRQMSPGGRHQFSGEHIGADECDTRALSGHRRSAIGSVSHQDDSALRPSGHIDLSGRIKVPIRRRWHHFQKPRDLPADSFIDRSERLLLLNPGLQINKRRVRRRNGCKMTKTPKKFVRRPATVCNSFPSTRIRGFLP
jgi:hypothetical protein